MPDGAGDWVIEAKGCHFCYCACVCFMWACAFVPDPCDVGVCLQPPCEGQGVATDPLHTQRQRLHPLSYRPFTEIKQGDTRGVNPSRRQGGSHRWSRGVCAKAALTCRRRKEAKGFWLHPKSRSPSTRQRMAKVPFTPSTPYTYTQGQDRGTGTGVRSGGILLGG